jgi:transposase
MDLPITYTDKEALVVVLGVDTHADAHVAVALDSLGRRLGHKTVPATEAGYALLVAWAERFGVLERAGIEGSGSFGVGLTRFLRAMGVEIVDRALAGPTTTPPQPHGGSWRSVAVQGIDDL